MQLNILKRGRQKETPFSHPNHINLWGRGF